MIIVPETPSHGPLDDGFRANVVKVFDGDGFLADLWNPYREAWVPRIPFRFAFIDAPEIQQPFGLDSRDFLNGLITGKTLRLDPVCKGSSGGMPFDQYKRILCVGYLTEVMTTGRIGYYLNGSCSQGTVKYARPTTRNIELEMIVNGWAWVVEQYSFEREADYFAAQEDAQRHRRGLWSVDDPEPPWNFKRRQKQKKRLAARQGNLFSVNSG